VDPSSMMTISQSVKLYSAVEAFKVIGVRV
jgi:hypothetical protein